MECYDEEAIAELITALGDTDTQFQAIVHIALAGGLREGEVCGLEWEDVDYQNNTITIRQASQYIAGRGIFTKTPKNESSKRTISLPEPVMSILAKLENEKQAQKDLLGIKWQGGSIRDRDDIEEEKPNRLFTKADGSPMYPNRVSKLWKEFVEKKGLPELTYHGLRHSSASYLIACGQDVVSVARRLGHSNSNTTLSTYAHAFKKRDVAAAIEMNKLYQPKKEKQKKE